MEKATSHHRIQLWIKRWSGQSFPQRMLSYSGGAKRSTPIRVPHEFMSSLAIKQLKLHTGTQRLLKRPLSFLLHWHGSILTTHTFLRERMGVVKGLIPNGNNPQRFELGQCYPHVSSVFSFLQCLVPGMVYATIKVYAGAISSCHFCWCSRPWCLTTSLWIMPLFRHFAACSDLN